MKNAASLASGVLIGVLGCGLIAYVYYMRTVGKETEEE